MRTNAALVPLSLIMSALVVAACTAGRDYLLVDEFEQEGEGGAGGTTGGVGGLFSGSNSSGVGPGAGVASSAASTGSGSGSSTGAGGDTPVDCANIPKGPFSFKVLTGHKASEDMDFDNQGNLVGADSGNLFKSTFDGQSQIWVPSSDASAGLRFTSKGILVYANVSANALYKVDPGPMKTFVVGGLSYPNGLDADNNGRIVVAEQNASQVRRVDPDTGQFEILAKNLNNPNGISFSPDYKTLYVGSFGGNIIYKITLDAQDKPVSQGVFIQNFTQNGTLDGMGVDACGNVYVCEYIAAKVWRIPPSGQNPELVVDLSSQTGWIPNMQWGSGVGGWDRKTLYVRDISSGKMYEVPVGVPTKPRKYP